MKNSRLQALAELLKPLSNDELVAVLQEVFTHKRPYPERKEVVGELASRFFIGVAYGTLAAIEDEQLDWEDHRNELPIEIEAVAYTDFDAYGRDTYWEDEFCQTGDCSTCGITLTSNAKKAICPICNGRKYLS